MGCKSSKAVQPQDVTTPQKGTIVIREKTSQISKSSRNSKNFSSSRESDSDYVEDSIVGQSDDRYGSAGSKRSDPGYDSGLGEHCLDHFITENSEADIVKKVENDFVERPDLELEISGVACPRRQSAKDKERLEEQRILASLREEGLITRPKSRAAGGLAFEITESEEGCKKRPPRLAKLELRRRKKKKNLTEEEIKEKLERAEERKKLKEAERLERINQLERGTKSALDNFQKSQKTKTEEQLQESQRKIDEVLNKREERLKELRDKLKRKNEHAEKVRLRKKLNVDNMTENFNENFTENVET